MKKIKRIIFLVVVLCNILISNSIVSAAEGDVLWTKIYNGLENNYDCGQDIAVDDEGNVYVIGTVHDGIGNGDMNIWICKYDKGGKEIWMKRYTSSGDNSDFGCGIAVDNEENVYITGAINNGLINKWDIWVGKFNKNGTEIWTRTNVNTNYDSGSGIAVDNAGNVYVIGSEGNDEAGGYENIWVRKYDKDGKTNWTRTHNGSSSRNDVGKDIAVDNAGNVYVAGTEYDVINKNDIWVRKYDKDGKTNWTRTHNSSINGNDKSYGIAVDNYGNAYVVGCENYISDNGTLWLRKYDKDGKTNWTRTCADSFYYFGIAVDKECNVFVVSDQFIRKYNTDGNIIWIKNHNNSGNSIAIDNSGNFSIVGHTNIGVNTDIWIQKYSCNLEIKDNSLPIAKGGESYIANFKATGGDVPYSWFLISGDLPLGLTLHSIGMISGMPATDGKFTFTVRVTEALGGIDEQTFSINFSDIIVPGKIKVIGGENGYINPDKNEEAKIIFNAKQPGNVKIKIYTLSRQLVTEMSHNAKAGINTVYWNGLNKENKKVATGIYIVFIKGAGMDTSIKIAVGY